MPRLDEHQFWVLGGAAVIGAALHYIGDPILITAALWFLVATLAGLFASSAYALLVALLAWPLGVGIGLATGRYDFLADGWFAALILSIVVGAVGFSVGMLVRRQFS